MHGASKALNEWPTRAAETQCMVFPRERGLLPKVGTP